MANATLQTYITQVQRLIHDAAAANYSTSELTDYINEAREDVALDMHCVRSFVTGVQLLQGQETYITEGAVAGVNITNTGSGYSSAPSVSFTAAPAGGVTPVGTAVLNASGGVGSVTLTNWGSDYTTAPTISFSGGGGSSAAASPIFFGNLVQVISISNIWNTERYMLNYRGFTLFQAYFRSWTTTFQARPGIWTFHQQAQTVYLRPMPDQLYLSEWDIVSLPGVLVNTSDIDEDVIPPWNKAVQFRAAAIALLKNQNFEQAEYYEKKYAERVPRYIMGAGGIRIPNPYNRTFQRRVSR